METQKPHSWEFSKKITLKKQEKNMSERAGELKVRELLDSSGNSCKICFRVCSWLETSEPFIFDQLSNYTRQLVTSVVPAAPAMYSRPAGGDRRDLILWDTLKYHCKEMIRNILMYYYFIYLCCWPAVYVLLGYSSFSWYENMMPHKILFYHSWHIFYLQYSHHFSNGYKEHWISSTAFGGYVLTWDEKSSVFDYVCFVLTQLHMRHFLWTVLLPIDRDNDSSTILCAHSYLYILCLHSISCVFFT